MKKIGLLLIASASIFAWSCLKDNNGLGDRNPALSTEFDYAMTKVYNLDVNYALNGYENPVQFAVYTEYPFISESSRQLKNIEPVLRGYVDQTGKYQGTLLLPISTQKVYLYTPALGVIQSVELAVTATGIAYDANAETKTVRSLGSTRASNAPADIDISVTGSGWNSVGKPNTSNGGSNISGSITKLINGVFKEGQNLFSRFSRLKNVETAFEISKAASGGANRVILTLFHADGIDLNTLCYYTYPTGTTPDLSKVHLTMALPNATFQTGMASGFNVDLKYWNGHNLVAHFPVGTSIGFCVIKDGFNKTTGAVQDNERFYTSYVAAGQTQHFVGFRGEQGNAEGYFGYDADGDNDFNDLVFFIDTTPSNAGTVAIVVDPNDDPDPIDPLVATVYSGTLIFEDLWPCKGDYDMNDVVMEYACKVWTDINNQVVKVEDLFWPIHNGAQLQNAFAYQYGVRPDQVKSMTFNKTYPGGLGEAKNYKALPWPMDSKGFEAGQPLANILLFDDIRAPQLTTGNYEYSIATEFTAPVSIATLGYPPYNPYIVIVYPNDDNNRGRELHLASYPGIAPLSGQYYPPTAKASAQWFGKEMDKSQPAQGIYYVSTQMYPFAINVPMRGFQLPAEMQKIDERYSQYQAWASSKGATNPEWYKHPN